MKKIDIENPCSINWNEMQDLGKDKFCCKCQKMVHDFTDKTDLEIYSLLQQDKNICARILSKKNVLQSLSLVITLTLSSCSPKITSVNNNIENVKSEVSTISGFLKKDYTESPVHNAQINFITLNKVFRVYTNELGAFRLNIPTKEIKKLSLIKIQYNEIKQRKDSVTFQNEEQVVFSKEQLSKPLKISYHNYAILGGIAISDHIVYNLHYVNGKKVSEKEFQKVSDSKKGIWIKLENENEKKAVINRGYLDSVYLYFTQDNIEDQ
ncbi:hypothetical protein M2T82_07020 [Elizabethkingia ursingii]|uniref:hypothetical protein n=1 Tax=Elizabethkingia ursingii TaxID=1756150 RepID=UPI002010EBF2|nr:hypothetical protein [Elizabethkingia ursingii]MCL1667812.1 hypothetical protein [Elizabethkingia ursingii]